MTDEDCSPIAPINYPITRSIRLPASARCSSGRAASASCCRSSAASIRATFNRYIEPFFGSGAVFFDLHGAGPAATTRVLLIDSNADLIGCYETVRDAPDAVARELERLADAHARDGRRALLRRARRAVQPARAIGCARADGRIAYTPALAAMLIYLNRTGFNGLFRVNAQRRVQRAGRPLRPAADRRPREAGARRRRAVAAGRAAAMGVVRDRRSRSPAAGDFVYFDPPYAPLTRTANFTVVHGAALRHAATGAAAAGRHRARAPRAATCWSAIRPPRDRRAVRAQRRGARRRACATMRVPARRAINSNAARRGGVEEFLITNVEPGQLRTARTKHAEATRVAVADALTPRPAARHCGQA